MQKFTLCKDRRLYGLWLLWTVTYLLLPAIQMFRERTLDISLGVILILTLALLFVVTRHMIHRVEIRSNLFYGTGNAMVDLMRVVEVDVVDHKLVIYDSTGGGVHIPMFSGMKLPSDYQALFQTLGETIPWDDVRIPDAVFELLQAAVGEEVDVDDINISPMKGGVLGLVIYYGFYALIDGYVSFYVIRRLFFNHRLYEQYFIESFSSSMDYQTNNFLWVQPFIVIVAVLLICTLVILSRRHSRSADMILISGIGLGFLQLIGIIQNYVISRLSQSIDWINLIISIVAVGSIIAMILYYTRTSRRMRSAFRDRSDPLTSPGTMEATMPKNLQPRDRIENEIAGLSDEDDSDKGV